MRKIILITAAILVVYCILAWFTGTWIGLEGSKVWMLRGALWALGIAAAGIVIWFFWNKKKQEEAAEFEDPSGSDDLDLLVREAENRLSASGAGKGSLGSLPVVFVIGETGVAKTTTVIHSGLEPELLAGQVYQDTDLIPTQCANIWYAQRAVLVEGAGNTVAEQGTWAKLARKLQPGRLRSAVGSGGHAPRAALVLVEAETFLHPGAAQALTATARALRARLGEISQSLGINLPVYVLLTKLDRVPFFADYVRNLTNEEAAQVLGVTVPMNQTTGGVYAEQEATRLNGVFEQLFRSLASARPRFLSREHDSPKLPGVYEFPREFRKMRANLVQFLVELCRPSQLTVGPFLRGFYFSGVRPVVVTEMAPAPTARTATAAPREAALHATGIFRHDAIASTPATPQKVVGTRKVPQWVFLSHFFHHVLLADSAARGASGSSVKTSMLRRVLLASAAALSLLYATALVVSYSKNRSLETTAHSAARGIEGVQPDPVTLASLDSLQRLETLRQSLAVLTEHQRAGAPLSYRWGLYTGDALYPEVRRLYFDGFNKVLLGQTQGTMVKSLAGLPLTPGPEFGPTYDTLKAYLMTTSHNDKTTREFLSPVLQDRWAAGRTVDPERAALAQKQFEFYADELKIANPFSEQHDAPVVAKARQYLNQFGGVERVYAAMLADAGKTNPPLNFNKKYVGSASTVLETYEVPGAFTKPGWDFMQASLNNPEKYFSGEQWVLGEQAGTTVDRATISKQLTDKYHSDFIRQWRNYLKSASVVKYANIQDAAAKLNTLSGNQSPLLALIWEASQNTAVDLPAAKAAFQPVQAVIPPGTDLFIGNENKQYVNALLALQASVDGAASAQQLTDAVAAPTLTNASAARMTTRQLAQTFRSDPEARVDATVQKLLEDPIVHVEALLKRLGPDELNGKGREVCGEFRKLWSKYPFNPKMNAPQATIAEVNALLRKPDGILWKFYEGNLQKLLPKQGAQYVAAEASGLTPAFVGFFNRTAAFSEAIYPEGAQEPMFKYALKPAPMEGILGIGLNLDGQTMSYTGGNSAAKQFVWQGTGTHAASASVKLGEGIEFDWYPRREGLWAVFQFFGNSETWRQMGNGHLLEWFVRAGNQEPMTDSKTGKPLTFRLELDMLGGPPVFQKDFFGRFGCVAEVAK
jgi:type VI secretion system protein ImpL